MKDKLIIGLLLIILCWGAIKEFYPGRVNHSASHTGTISRIDTTEFFKQFEAEFASRLKAEKKTVFIDNTQVTNIDSLIKAAKEYWIRELKDSTLSSYDFKVRGDTTFTMKDSAASGTVDIYAEYISPVPLHPAGKLKLGGKVNLKVINSYTEKTVTVSEMPELLLGVGAEAVFENNKIAAEPFFNINYNKNVLFFIWTSELKSNIEIDAGKVRMSPSIRTGIAIGF